MINKKRLIDQLIVHEGLVLNSYECTAGKVTIGVGRNLEDNGISKEEAMYLLENDIARIAGTLYRTFDWFKDLSESRKEAVINMVFNMGLGNFQKFKKTISYIERGEFELAGAEALNSRWAEQVGDRSLEICQMISSGEYQKR